MLATARRLAAQHRLALLFSAVLLASVAGGTTVVWKKHHNPPLEVQVQGQKFTQTPKSNGGGSGGGNNGNGLGNGGGAKLSFTLSATVGGLTPGDSQGLPIQIDNPSTNNGTLTVDTLHVQAQDAVVDGVVVCAASNLQVGSYDESAPYATAYTAPRGGSVTVTVPIEFKDLLDVDQTSCRGQTLPLVLSGTATVNR